MQDDSAGWFAVLHSMADARANLLCAKGLPNAERLDVEHCLRTLDSWAELIRSETHRYVHQFKQNPAEYENSPGYYRMIMMVTVLQKDLGVRYNPDAIGNWDFSDCRDVFIQGLLGEKRTGTCASMPVLYVALGRRLGYPLSLVPAKGHLFVRWDDTSKGGERFNIEATSQGIICPTDDHYATWPMPLSRGELGSGYYLRSLTPTEELAEFLAMRGHCLEDLERVPDAVAIYGLAHSLVPDSPRYRWFLTAAVEKEDSVFAMEGRLVRQNQMRPSIPIRQEQRDAFIESLNEHNRRLMTGEFPTNAAPPSRLGSSP